MCIDYVDKLFENPLFHVEMFTKMYTLHTQIIHTHKRSRGNTHSANDVLWPRDRLQFVAARFLSRILQFILEVDLHSPGMISSARIPFPMPRNIQRSLGGRRATKLNTFQSPRVTIQIEMGHHIHTELNKIARKKLFRSTTRVIGSLAECKRKWLKYLSSAVAHFVFIEKQHFLWVLYFILVFILVEETQFSFIHILCEFHKNS